MTIAPLSAAVAETGAALIEMEMAEARRLNLAAARGDAEARAFFAGLFAPATACLLCDVPIGAARFTLILPRPRSAGRALLAPLCRTCASLPPAERRARQLAMLRAMWPGSRWRPKKDEDPAYLRGGPGARARAGDARSRGGAVQIPGRAPGARAGSTRAHRRESALGKEGESGVDARTSPRGALRIR